MISLLPLLPLDPPCWFWALLHPPPPPEPQLWKGLPWLAEMTLFGLCFVHDAVAAGMLKSVNPPLFKMACRQKE